MDYDDIDERLHQALVKMHVYERGHNSISYTHTKEMLQLIFEMEPCDEKIMLSRLRVSLGMDNRYISQYYKGLLAWGVLYRSEGIIYADKPEILPREKKEIEQKDPETKEKNNSHKLIICIWRDPKTKLCTNKSLSIEFLRNKKTSDECEACEHREGQNYAGKWLDAAKALNETNTDSKI